MALLTPPRGLSAPDGVVKFTKKSQELLLTPEMSNEQRPASAAPLPTAAWRKVRELSQTRTWLLLAPSPGEESQNARGADLVLPGLAGALTGSLQICLQKKTPAFIIENSLRVKALCPAEEPWILQEEEIPFPWILWQLSHLPSNPSCFFTHSQSTAAGGGTAE